jgi:hypothetical protein
MFYEENSVLINILNKVVHIIRTAL